MSDRRYRLFSDKVVAKVLEHEAVVINLETGLYYGLEGPSATVWEQLSAGVPQAEVASSFGAAYPGKTDDSAVEALATRLVAEKLLAPQTDASETHGVQDVQADWPQEYAALDLTCYDDVAEMVALDPPLPELDYGN